MAYKPETGKQVTVQVKTAQRRNWIVGHFKHNPDGSIAWWKIADEADVYVFVHLPTRNIHEVEFFVVKTKRLKELCEKYVAKVPPMGGTKGGLHLILVSEHWWREKGLMQQEAWEEFLAYKDLWDLLDEVAK